MLVDQFTCCSTACLTMDDVTSGDGIGSGAVPSEASSEKTFHIYVLSFAYGILVVSCSQSVFAQY